LSSALDAAGSAAVFLMGFYFFGQIVVFGAVFTRVYASMFGSKILPERDQGQRADT
jgi:membrane protein